MIGGIVWTTCVLMGLGFHFGSGGNIPLLPIFMLTLVFVHCDAILICANSSVTEEAIYTLSSLLLALLGLAGHVVTDDRLQRILALGCTLLGVLIAARNVITLAWAAASSTLHRHDAGVDAVSSVLSHVCDTLLGVLFMFVALWKYCRTDDTGSLEFTLTSTAVLISVCLMDMCIFHLAQDKEPALRHAHRALSGVLLALLECVTMTKHVEQLPVARGV
ncbi:uncharacterized protein LOC124622568 [Schistocerca americana]|uniref:uncharacterized protein LOC124622568 n=1 Tax=Schistocerca americana TaxID=7009 RepID=UPI001F4F258C|nr:uncharacterized protein LOC124622568 [Schistocerca americana]XP_047004272.1 uncharacterized protein LOC124622568 [Schistocerca americana]